MKKSNAILQERIIERQLNDKKIQNQKIYDEIRKNILKLKKKSSELDRVCAAQTEQMAKGEARDGQTRTSG